MDVGVGLNATIPGVSGSEVLEWARAADDTELSSLGVIDRMTYPNHEPLASLAVAAGATQRIGLMTTVLVAPQRSPGVLAKQAATIDALSGGRLSLGVGIGSREADYRAAGGPVAFADRADGVERQLGLMRRVWDGRKADADLDPIGPRPTSPRGPELLYGGYSTAAARRAGRCADGFLAGNLPPDAARELYDVALDARHDDPHGEGGRFRFVVCGYFGLGEDDDVQRGREYLRDYYSFREGLAERTVDSLLDSEAAITDRLDACEQAGVDEVVLWPTIADVEQVRALAAVVVGRRSD